MVPAPLKLPLLLLVPLWGAGCLGQALDPYAAMPCESDLDCPDTQGCQMVSVEGDRQCQPLTGASPGGGGPSIPGVTPEYCDVKPLFARYCNTCHGQDATASGTFTRRFDQYENDADGRLGVKDSADRIQVRMVSFKDMPPQSFADQPTDEERETVDAWIKGGTPNNCGASEASGT